MISVHEKEKEGEDAKREEGENETEPQTSSVKEEGENAVNIEEEGAEVVIINPPLIDVNDHGEQNAPTPSSLQSFLFYLIPSWMMLISQLSFFILIVLLTITHKGTFTQHSNAVKNCACLPNGQFFLFNSTTCCLTILPTYCMSAPSSLNSWLDERILAAEIIFTLVVFFNMFHPVLIRMLTRNQQQQIARFHILLYLCYLEMLVIIILMSVVDASAQTTTHCIPQ
jgi:hypothetical protein